MKTYIKPQCSKHGKLDRYYHYIFGYIYPIFQNIEPFTDKEFFVVSCGEIMDNIAREINDTGAYKLEIIRPFRARKIHSNISFANFDGPWNYHRINLDLLRKRITQIFPALSNLTVSKDVAIINRLPADNYYNSRRYRSGATKRNIPNINELSHSLTTKNIPHNIISFERKSFFEQLSIFASHKIFVGQHGAAFSHLPVAPKDTKVLEIMPRGIFGRTHWSHLSFLYKYHHQKIIQRPNAVSPINVKKITTEIERLYNELF